MTPRIGLEVHVPLDTDAKLYCPCPATPAPRPNTHICPTCTGQPGARPQGLNRRALKKSLQAALLLDCHLDPHATVQRKHYVYPDLPNNYQRTSTPLGRDGRFWDVHIEEVHLEEDPGAYDPQDGTVDLNRSGRPLLEIVTHPDLDTPHAVDEWLDVLRLALDRAGIKRPETPLKADVNVSTQGGDRVEVKNVVGGANATQAAQHEIQRQTRLRERDEPIPRQTRHFDEDTGQTHASREKETVGDYRYMPDPDLPRLDLTRLQERIQTPDDASQRVATLQDRYDVQLGEALALLRDPSLENVFERVRDATSDEHALEVVLRRLRGELDYRDATLGDTSAQEQTLVDLARAWHEEDITKHVFTRLLRDHLDGEDIHDQLASERGSDVDLAQHVVEAIEKNPGAVEDYEQGNENAIDFLVGRVLEATQGRADPREARSLLQQELDA